MPIKILTDKQLHFALIHAIKANLNDQHATKGDPCWAPPNFPEQGRLTLNYQQVRENIKKIDSVEFLGIFDTVPAVGLANGLREPFGGYFLSRMIYFGDKWSKSMRILSADEFTYRDKNNKKYIKLDYLPTYGLNLINKKIDSRIKDDKSIQTNQVTKVINKLNEIKIDKNTQKISNSLNHYINN